VPLLQSWALLEEQQGLYTPANELRSYSLQEQTSVVPPLNLGTQPDDPLITSIFKQVSLFWLLLCQAIPLPVALLTCVCGESICELLAAACAARLFTCVQ